MTQIPLLKECGALRVKPGAPFCCFELSGEPRGKGAPRFRIAKGPRGFFPVAYKDAKTASYMRDIAMAAKIAMGSKLPTNAPVQLVIHAFFSVPKSRPSRQRMDALNGTILPTVKFDWDNIAKVVGDALKEIVWIDDALVVDGRVIKLYSDVPGIRVEVREFG